jgi:hypothetical protein
MMLLVLTLLPAAAGKVEGEEGLGRNQWQQPQGEYWEG